MKYFVTIIIAGISLLGSAQEGLNIAFAKANKAYTAEKYEIAIAGYNQILKAQVHSAELYFNLANAHYKLNHIAPAIYNYEKALQLDPANVDIKTNLGYANQMKLDAIEELPKQGFKVWFNETIKGYSTDSWAYLSLVAALFTVLLFILYFYAIAGSKKRLFFILSLFALVLTLCFIYSAFTSLNLSKTERFAIIFDTEVVTRTEPRAQAESLFTLHEGTKVAIVETFENWVRVELANGSKAWVPLQVLKEL